MNTEVAEDFVERRSKFLVYLNVKLSYINILSKGAQPQRTSTIIGGGGLKPPSPPVPPPL